MMDNSKVFQIGIDPVRERAGLLLAARTIACVRYFVLEFELDKLRQNNSQGGSLWQQVKLLEQQLKLAKVDKNSTQFKSQRANDDHEKFFQGDPRMILTPEEKKFIETNLSVPGLILSRSLIEEHLSEAIIIGVSAATSDYNRLPEACPYCGSRDGGSVRGIIR